MSVELKIVKAEDVLPNGQPKPEIITSEITWLVAKGGFFVRKENALYNATVKIDSVASLGDIKSTWRLHVPKMALELFKQTEAFFQEIYSRHKSEAVVILYACPDVGWHIECPTQEVGCASASYKRDQMPTNIKIGEWEYTIFGSIHSHAGMKAFHSGTDDKDEFSFDGLHITIGEFDKDVHSYACRLIFHGHEFKVEVGEVIDGIKVVEKPPEAWLAKVSEHSYTVSPTGACQSEHGLWDDYGHSGYGFQGYGRVPVDVGWEEKVAAWKKGRDRRKGKKEPQIQKISFKKAQYVPQAECTQCWGCVNFKGHKKCQIVSGDISESGCCDLFDPTLGFQNAINGGVGP